MSFPSDFDSYRCEPEGSAVALDFSGMLLSPDFHRSLEPKLQAALAAMQALEAGAIANPDENRMVGHYWLRTPALAPNAQIRADIERDIADVRTFAAKVHAAEVRPEKAPAFTRVLVIGIGGSALGPQLVADALGQPGRDRMAMHFLDNTDPEGIERELRRIGGAEGLKSTLAVTISKSGGTPETRNGMLLAAEAYAAAGLQFSRHAVVVTGAGSKLDQTAQKEGVLARFPMYDWVGGRTSVMSAVGLLPMALQGLDISGFLAGASAMDRATRADAVASNPALLMAALWHAATSGRGEKDMVVLPYCDRLLLFSRYLQQLVMESLGKEKDLAGNVVHQGISVYGNKGSTDQHAYVQQLREGVPNFFAVFVEVLSKGGSSLRVEGDATTGDFLNGFLMGTRRALREAGRPTMTLTVERLNAETLGALVALFERTVGFYATMVGINAYHQPGVEAGKKAAAGVLSLQTKLLTALSAAPGEAHTAEAWAARAGAAGEAEAAFSILRHLAYNGRATMSGRGSKARFAGA